MPEEKPSRSQVRKRSPTKQRTDRQPNDPNRRRRSESQKAGLPHRGQKPAKPSAPTPRAERAAAARRPAREKDRGGFDCTAAAITGLADAAAVGADGDARKRTLRQDRRARRSVGVADRRARAAGPRGHARAAALSRCRRRRQPSVFRRALRLGDRLQPVDVPRAPPVGPRHARARRRPRALRPRRDSTASPSGDFPDNALRFAVFSRAALEYPRLREQRPSIIHAHDWQTGLVPVYQKMHLSTDPFVGGVPAVFTIHNLAFQGVFPASTLAGDRPRLRGARRAGPRVLGQHQLPEGRHQLQREDHDRQPGLRERDRPARARLRLRRRPRAGGPTDLVGILNGIDTRALDADGGRVRAGVVQRRRSRRQARREARAARGRRPAGRRRGAGAAGHRARVAPDRSEGLRPHPGRVGRADGARRDVGHARQRRARATRRRGGRSRPAIPTACRRRSGSTSGWRTTSRPAPTCS